MSRWTEKVSIEIPNDHIGYPFYFDVNGESIERLIAVIALRSQTYKGWSFYAPDNRIVLWQYVSDKDLMNGVSRFISEMDAEAVAYQVWSWLSSKEVEWDEEPDHDGSNAKGWRAHVDDVFGHCFQKLPEESKRSYAGADWGAALAISPLWLEYHK
jgi:hypothetical protein